MSVIYRPRIPVGRLVVGAVVVCAWVASYWRPTLLTEPVVFGLHFGCIACTINPPFELRALADMMQARLAWVTDDFALVATDPIELRRTQWLPLVKSWGNCVVVRIPFWPILAALLLMPNWSERRRVRRIRRGLCGKCGYDLRGSGEQCPECGGPREVKVEDPGGMKQLRIKN